MVMLKVTTCSPYSEVFFDKRVEERYFQTLNSFYKIEGTVWIECMKKFTRRARARVRVPPNAQLFFFLQSWSVTLLTGAHSYHRYTDHFRNLHSVLWGRPTERKGYTLLSVKCERAFEKT